MKNLYNKRVYEEILQRINQLGPSTKPLWGKMDTAQMMTHCDEVLQTYNGDKALKVGLLGRVFKGMVKKIVFGPHPYKKNSPTVPQFKVTTTQDFNEAKSRLLRSLDRFHTMSQEEIASLVHPLFGKVSMEDRGWAMYKHIDHHLQQFGV